MVAMSGLPYDFRDALAGASELQLWIGMEIRARIPLGNVRRAVAEHRRCTAEISRQWDVDEAALAALRQRPTTTNLFGLRSADYPTAALRRATQGRVIVRIDVGADGRRHRLRHDGDERQRGNRQHHLPGHPQARALPPGDRRGGPAGGRAHRFLRDLAVAERLGAFPRILIGPGREDRLAGLLSSRIASAVDQPQTKWAASITAVAAKRMAVAGFEHAEGRDPAHIGGSQTPPPAIAPVSRPIRGLAAAISAPQPAP